MVGRAQLLTKLYESMRTRMITDSELCNKKAYLVADGWVQIPERGPSSGVGCAKEHEGQDSARPRERVLRRTVKASVVHATFDGL